MTLSTWDMSTFCSIFHACYLQLCTIIVSYLHFTLGSLSVSDLDTVMEETSAVCGKWESIGQELGMYEKYLTEIRTPYTTSHDRLREMVSRWLNRKAGFVFVGETTWRRIIVALRSIGEPQLADNLKTKYIPGE